MPPQESSAAIPHPSESTSAQGSAPDGRTDGPGDGVRPSWRELGLLLALLCLAGLWKFEDKGVLYFDELINAGLAKDGVILDFSLRPVYRLLNQAAWLVFGGDFESLRMLAFLCYLATGLVVFETARRLSGRAVAWSVFLAVAFSETVLVHGVRGMPHVPAGLFLALALCYFLSSLDAAGGLAAPRWRAVAAGLVALVAVAVHPTALPFVLGLGLWALARLAVRASRTRGWSDLPREPAFALLLALGVGALVLFGVTLLDDRSYVGAIFGGVETVQAENVYSFYHRPWHQYLTTLAGDVVLLTAVVLAVLGAVLAWAATRGGGSRSPAGDRTVALVWLSVCSLGVLSLLAWRFERVFVTYVPLLAVTAAALLSSALGALRPRRRRVAAAGLVAVLALAAAVSLVRTTAALERIDRDDWKQFDRFAEVLSSVVEGGEVGYLGDGARYERARDFVGGAGHRLACLESGTERPADELERELIERGVSFVLTDFSDPSDRRSFAFWWNGSLTSLELEEVYEHRDFFRLWRVQPRRGAVELREALLGIEGESQVAVLGWPEELDPLTDHWIQSQLDQHRLRGYRLSLLKSGVAQFNYVPRKGIRYVWLTPSSRTIEGSNYYGFRRQVVAAGARLVAEDPIAPAELWEMPR